MFGNGKAFISHTHEDNAACAPVLAALDAWQVDYWFDTAQLSAGLELLDNIQRGLSGRDIFLRICTPAANASPWMAQEQQLARTLRAPNREQRLMIDLIVKPGYVVSAEEAGDVVIDATQQPEVEWLLKLREALEIPSRERRVSRRAVLSVGITSLAALGGMGLAGKLLFFTPPAPNLFLPVGHQPTPTALPGASRIRWTFSIYPSSFGTAVNVSLAGQMLICAANGTLTALDKADGKFRWIQRDYRFLVDAPPTVISDSIYVTYSEYVGNSTAINLAAFNLSDGSERWHQLIFTDSSGSLDIPSTSAVTVDGSAAYVRCNQTLYACDATTGKTIWSQSAGEAKTDLGEVLPAPTVAGNVVFAILGDRKLHAFSAVNGAPLWPAPFASDLPIRTRPVVADGMVFVGADGGLCYALDVVTGATRWKTDLLAHTKNPVDAQERARFTLLGLTLNDNVLYFSGGWPLETFTTSVHQTAILALNPTTGAILWAKQPEFDFEHPNLDATLFRASPLVAGNSIFMATKLRATTGRDVDILYALNKQDGTLKWNFQVWGYDTPFSDTDGVPSAPIIADDLLYVISGDEMLYALSYAD